MAKMNIQILDYQSDLVVGGTDGDNSGIYKNLRHKVRQGYEQCYDSKAAGGACSCPVTGLFRPRYLEGTFSADPTGLPLSKNCAKIRVVVSTPAFIIIAAEIQRMKACGAICIDYVGERWANVPPALGGYTPSSDLFELNAGVRSPFVTGISEKYLSDALLQPQGVRVRYEAVPVALTGAVLPGNANDSPTAGGQFLTCHGELSKSALCGTAVSIKPREAVLKGQGTVQGILTGQKPSAIVRRVPIYQRSLILDCIKNLGNIKGVHCVGYEGERIKNVHLLV